jgi:predicted phosphodiesterase
VTSIVIVGDIHGNARALRAALAQARKGPVDRIVFMGDLLTYGHDVTEVLDMVGDAQDRDDAILLTGNHDQMYFDLAEGKRDYLDNLPGWIKDSVMLTVQKFDPSSLRSRFRWSRDWALDGAIFAHANPFPFGDFRYLNSDADHEAALGALSERHARLGVFGHTHRPLWRPGPITLANAGSVGQPRDNQGSIILRLGLHDDTVTGTFESVAYDVQSHMSELQRTGLPEATTRRLCGFFEQPR